jgi:hypothetical protein
MGDNKFIQKNIIKALNERKYLRNLQNEFKPKMFFKENRSKAPIRVVAPKSYSPDSSAHTINESIFSDDISPFSYITVDDGGDSNIGSDNTTNDDDSSLSKSTEIITYIFDKYSESKTDNGDSDLLTSPSGSANNSPREFSDENVLSDSDNTAKTSSLKLPSFINSINLLLKSATQNNQNNKNKKKIIQRIFVKSPDYTPSVETDISQVSTQVDNSIGSSKLSSVSTEVGNSTKSFYSADSTDESKIKIRKNRVLIKKNIINNKVSQLIPLKISFFGGSYNNSDEKMSYEQCKTIIQSLTEENISVNLKIFLNESLNNEVTTNTVEKPCAKEIEEKDKELTELKIKAEELEKENIKLKELEKENIKLKELEKENKKPEELKKPFEIGSTDMGLSELLNASLNKTANPLQNDTGSNKLINESSNDIGLTKMLNTSLNGTVNPSQNDLEIRQMLNESLNGTVNPSPNSNQMINTSLTGPSKTKPSAKDDQKYVVEITFNNETLEPTDIIINRVGIFETMNDEDKPSNYLFSVNQFIMEQIKTKNRGYILEGETTMACYCSDDRTLDFDTAVFSF